MSRVDVRRVTVTGTSFGAGQQTFRLLWNAIFHCRVRNKARVTLLCMSHTINIHPFISYFLIININIVPLSSFSFSRRFVFSVPALPTKFLYAFTFAHMHATWPTHITILDALTIITVANLEKCLRYKTISLSTNVLNVTNVTCINVTVLLPFLTSQLHQ